MTFEHCSYLDIASKSRHTQRLLIHPPAYGANCFGMIFDLCGRQVDDILARRLLSARRVSQPLSFSHHLDGELGSKFTSAGVRERQDKRERAEDL